MNNPRDFVRPMLIAAVALAAGCGGVVENGTTEVYGACSYQ